MSCFIGGTSVLHLDYWWSLWAHSGFSFCTSLIFGFYTTSAPQKSKTNPFFGGQTNKFQENTIALPNQTQASTTAASICRCIQMQGWCSSLYTETHSLLLVIRTLLEINIASNIIVKCLRNTEAAGPCQTTVCSLAFMFTMGLLVQSPKFKNVYKNPDKLLNNNLFCCSWSDLRGKVILCWQLHCTLRKSLQGISPPKYHKIAILSNSLHSWLGFNCDNLVNSLG